MGQIKLLSSFILIALFTFAVITFAIQFGSDNDSRVSLADEEEFERYKISIENNASTVYSDAETATKAVTEMTISSQTDATEGGTAFKVGPWTAFGMVKTAISSSYTRIFGSDFAMFYQLFIGLLGFVIILYIIKAWKGNPD